VAAAAAATTMVAAVVHEFWLQLQPPMFRDCAE